MDDKLVYEYKPSNEEVLVSYKCYYFYRLRDKRKISIILLIMFVIGMILYYGEKRDFNTLLYYLIGFFSFILLSLFVFLKKIHTIKKTRINRYIIYLYDDCLVIDIDMDNHSLKKEIKYKSIKSIEEYKNIFIVFFDENKKTGLPFIMNNNTLELVRFIKDKYE